MIETILKGINNRDIASFFWVLVISLFTIVQSYRKNAGVFSAFKALIKSVLHHKLMILLLILLLNTLFSVYFLKLLNLWDLSQLKNTFLWFLFTGLVFVGKAINSEEYNDLLKNTVLANLKLIIFLEFFVNLYVFNIFVEICLVFITTSLFILSIFSEKSTDINELRVNQLSKTLISIIGVLLIMIIFYQLVNSPENFFNRLNFLNLVTPINLTILSLPSVVTLFIIKSYEDFFTYYNIRLNQSNEVKAIKHTIIKRINFKINSLNMLREIVMSKRIHTLSDINHTINLIEKHRQLRKNPPYIPIESGWSPFIASKFLTNYGIKCNFYKPLYNGWFAQSKFFRVGSLLNNITYYISGNERKATRLCLKIDLYDLKEKESLLTIFCNMVEQLYSQANNHKIDCVFIKKIIELSSYTKDFEFFSVSIITSPYEHREGYLVSFILKSHNHSDL